MSFELSRDVALGFGKAKPCTTGFICECPTCQKATLSVTDDGASVSMNCMFGCDAETIYQVALAQGLINRPTGPRQLVINDANHWLKQPVEKNNPIIPGLFDAGDKIVIIGQSKTRKSFFTMQLALSIASNRKFLHFETVPKKVLLFQFEIKGPRYHERLKKMSDALEIETLKDGMLGVINARGIFDNTEDTLKAIKVQVRIFNPEVVILDPLYKLIGGDESKVEEVKPILSFFDLLAESSKAAIIYVHHDKKGYAGDQQLTDRGSGSGVLARDFDSAFFLSPHKDVEEALVVEFIARNYPPLNPVAIAWSENKFILSDASTDKKTARSSANRKVKNSELVERAKDYIIKDTVFGNNEYGMGLFNAKLEDLGIPTRALTGIKQSLEREGLIEIRKGQSGHGQSNFIVTLIKQSDVAYNAVSEFKEEYQSYEEGGF